MEPSKPRPLKTKELAEPERGKSHTVGIAAERLQDLRRSLLYRLEQEQKAMEAAKNKLAGVEEALAPIVVDEQIP